MKLMEEELNKITGITEIVSGGAQGADSLAESYAKKNGIRTRIFKPEYDKFGRAAPLVRNRQIIQHSDLVIAFWDGKSRGTKYTIDYAQSENKPVQIILF